YWWIRFLAVTHHLLHSPQKPLKEATFIQQTTYRSWTCLSSLTTIGTISTIKRSGNFSTKHGEWPQALELRNILNIGDSIRRSLPNWIGLKMLSWEMDSAFTVSRQDIFPVVA